MFRLLLAENPLYSFGAACAFLSFDADDLDLTCIFAASSKGRRLVGMRESKLAFLPNSTGTAKRRHAHKKVGPTNVGAKAAWEPRLQTDPHRIATLRTVRTRPAVFPGARRGGGDMCTERRSV